MENIIVQKSSTVLFSGRTRANLLTDRSSFFDLLSQTRANFKQYIIILIYDYKLIKI